MTFYTVLGVPKGFPCRAAAMHVLRAAQEHRADRIKIEKPGHTCEFSVDEVARQAAKAPTDTLVSSGTTRTFRSHGNTFEWRKQNWPGMSLGPTGGPFLQGRR